CFNNVTYFHATNEQYTRFEVRGYTLALTIDQLRQKRIGLVLSGGGAKGAYQIGCCKALRKHGITNFAAVAGTSVGALNAVFIAANKCDLAESEWRGLNWREVIALKPAELLFLPIW